MGGDVPDLSAGLPNSHVHLDRGEDTPTDTEWAQREQTGRWNQVCDLGLKSPGAKGHCCFIGSDQQGRRELLQEGL